MAECDLKRYIRDIPDFPKPGILFRDITPLLRHPEALRAAIDRLEEAVVPHQPTAIAGIEARGFIFGAPLALRLGVGFIPLRKPGKLPWETHRASYTLEYASGTLEMHRDACGPGDRVVLVDDLLATGGTAGAAVGLLEQTGAVVPSVQFVIELADLGGRALLPGRDVGALIRF